MTVRYNSIGHVRPFGFARLLFRWEGSIWHSIWVELCSWVVLFYLISFGYRLSWLADGSSAEDNPSSKRIFEQVVLDWNANNTIVPVTFVLGFYTSIMFTRWWAQFLQVPWIDPLCQALNVSLRAERLADKDEVLQIKRSIIRWINLASCLVYQDCSQKIKQESFPDLAALVRLGVLNRDEMNELNESLHDTHAFYLPYSWSHAVLNQAQDKGFIRSDIHMRLLIDKLESQRLGHGNLLGYGWVSIPLLFTQVVTAAVYTHFAFALVSEQFLDPAMKYPGHEADWGIPFFSMMRIVTLVGWLKASELMKSPFGSDADSFEIDWIIRRNLDVGLDIVTRQCDRFPKVQKDAYWESSRTPGMDALRQRHRVSGGREQRASSYGRHRDSHSSNENKDQELGNIPLL